MTEVLVPEVSEARATEISATLPLSRIKPGTNPRRYFSPAKHAELVASLRLRGLLQPILLRPAAEDDSYLLVAGGRRYRAAVEAFGPDGEVPVIIRDMTDREALEAAIDENDVREDASETEQADAALRVLAACDNDRAEAAKRLGWSPAKLDRRVALAGLSDTVKTALDERRIKVGHAELLAAVPADKQDKALETILSAGIDVAKTRELLMRMTHSLSAATFDKSECTSCGYNSARQRALFETHVEDGHCTNGACYALKTEAAEKARKEVEPAPAAMAPAEAPVYNHGTCRICGCTDDHACAEPCSWADESQTLCDNPDCIAKAATPVPTELKPAADAVPAKPASAGSAKPKVTATGLADKLAVTRQKAWREAVAATLTESADHLRVADIAAALVKSGEAMGFNQVAGLARDFEVDLRATWRVNGTFLALLSKDELKFVAMECGLVAHMGEKAFAKLLAVPVSDLITGVLHVTGFDWAGRLPAAMTLDGQYGPPPAAAPISDKD